ncbi:hypothetical protein BJ508DRAFT_416355 [Ascobolus immersus RN42]|uniref:SET domain-containing protein n=1 Tax=Ascobolus immersus RN42 TaxID=1160509 RepID=A0A3N4HYJ5_ASCIM|nr:hypothetical protein BJ508DRAFT_416355 [Ascobolus immersus RN42]
MTVDAPLPSVHSPQSYLIETTPSTLLTRRTYLTDYLVNSYEDQCYSLINYLRRAAVHLRLGYGDLCASDAYAALELGELVAERVDELGYEESDDGYTDDEDEEGKKEDFGVMTEVGNGCLRRMLRELDVVGDEEEVKSRIEEWEGALKEAIEGTELLARLFVGLGLMEVGCLVEGWRFLADGIERVEELLESNEDSEKEHEDSDEEHEESSIKTDDYYSHLISIILTTFTDIPTPLDSPPTYHLTLLHAFNTARLRITHLLNTNLPDRLPPSVNLPPLDPSDVKSIQTALDLLRTTHIPLNPEPSVISASQFPVINDGLQGYCRREVYPWNYHEPERLSDENLKEVNALMDKCAHGRAEVKVVELPTLGEDGVTKGTNKQLGVYATEDIHENEHFFTETSFLMGVSDPFSGLLCDICASKIYEFTSSSSYSQVREKLTCPSCPNPAIYCSQACLDAARETYHPAVCGKDLGWFYKDVQTSSNARALWNVMLLKSFATSLSRSAKTPLPEDETSYPVEAQIHPLDMHEVKSAWGTYYPRKLFSEEYIHSGLPPNEAEKEEIRLLPFTFTLQILQPRRMFLEGLKVDLHKPENFERFDTWVINTLYAKFLGTASSRLAFGTAENNAGTAGANRAEVCAMHLCWSLVNHSCEPNVRWECEGSIQFRGRCSDESKADEKRVAVRKDEEILMSYCDVRMGYKERREWMVGSLGGACRCERCLREEGEDLVERMKVAEDVVKGIKELKV